MTKSILLIDDEKIFMEAFKIKAQNEGYKLAWGRSFEELEEKLPLLASKIVGVILDVKCLIKNDQEIEKQDFIGVAINYLAQNYPELPRVILTGDEKAIDAIKMFFNADTEDIFTKSPKDIEKLFRKLDFHHTNFPERYLETEHKKILNLLKEEEGKHLEFKSSLRFSIQDNIEDKSLEFESFKNIAAFLNTGGGTLLLGINDDKEIIGLEDYDFTTFNKPNKEDAFKLHIDNLIEKFFGNAVQRVIDVHLIKVDGKSVCKINIHKCYQEPVFIKKKAPNTKAYMAFYIRRQSSARELRNKEVEEYISGQWN